MNNDLFNDTFDNFTFPSCEKLLKQSDGVSSKIVCGTSTNRKFDHIDKNQHSISIGTVSFDDSVFLSESFTFTEDAKKSELGSNEDIFNSFRNDSSALRDFQEFSRLTNVEAGLDNLSNLINTDLNNDNAHLNNTNGIINSIEEILSDGENDRINEVLTNQKYPVYSFNEPEKSNCTERTGHIYQEKTVALAHDSSNESYLFSEDNILNFNQLGERLHESTDSDIFVGEEEALVNSTKIARDIDKSVFTIEGQIHKLTFVQESAVENIVSTPVSTNKELKAIKKNYNSSTPKIDYRNNGTNCKNVCTESPPKDNCILNSNLSDWNLPNMILQKYEKNNVKSMFEWQVQCLSNENVLHRNKNLVYSAPTSAGKTLVAEILAIKTLIERHKKVIFVLPFVSVVREKMFHFQDLLGTSGIRAEGFMGSYHPPGGFKTVQLAICTIEKANSLINRLLEEGELSEIGAVVIDEMHLLGDPGRGYLLELLLTKLKYMSLKNDDVNIQIIGMSATLPNLDLLAKWLDADLYTTTFRPIPLVELCQLHNEIYDNNLELVRKLSPLPELETDTDNILQLCLETIKTSCSVLIFCPTKNWCESLAQQISTAFWKLGNAKTNVGECLKRELSEELVTEVLEQLKRCPVGLDKVLERAVSFAVAFHHAGLTMDERDIIEGAFRSGAIRVLIATSTLSSGVNLPARRVIVRTPTFYGKPIDTLTYRQMIGRAGRMGKDTAGESLLICQKNDIKIAKQLMSAELSPIESCLQSGKLKRAILEIIASGVASSPDDVRLFSDCTLLASEENDGLENPIEDAIKFLERNEFIRLQALGDGTPKYVATSLAKACLSSSLPPEEGLTLFTELEKARQCFVLETELHLIYLVTPYSACNQWGNIDWMFYLTMWEKLPASMKRVGELVGVRESFLVQASRGRIHSNSSAAYHKLQVHKRFYTALALQDLVNEVPLNIAAAKFSCARGLLQTLQQSASTFAGMVTVFSRQLGWSSVELLISQFQDRLHFGINRELLDLMRLPIMNGPRARALYNGGIESLVELASASVDVVENILHKVIPFETGKEREGETKYEAEKRVKIRAVWVTGKRGLTEKEAADLLISDARQYLQFEMGLVDAKWSSFQRNGDSKSNDSTSSNESEKKKTINGGIEDDCRVVINCDEAKQMPDGIKITESINVKGSKSLSERSELKKNMKKENAKRNVLYTIEKKNLSKIFEGYKIGLKKNEHQNVEENIQNSTKENPNSPIVHEKKELITKRAPEKGLLCLEKESASNDSNQALNQITNASEMNDSMTRNEAGNRKLNIFETNFSLLDLQIKKENISTDVNLQEQNMSTLDVNLNLEIDSSIINVPTNEIFSSRNSTPGANVSNEVIVSSQTETLVDSPLKLMEFNKTFTRKRKMSEEDLNITKQCIPQTPTKKKKVIRYTTKKKPKINIDPSFVISQDQANLTIVPYTKQFETTDLSKLDIVNVCDHEKVFESFCLELDNQKEISLSVGCDEFAISKPKIGTKVSEVESQIQKKEYSYGKLQIKGISLSWGGSVAYYISFDSKTIQNENILHLLKRILSKHNLKVRMFNAKEHIKLLNLCLGIKFSASIDDPKIGDWLLDPDGKEKGLQAMASHYSKAVSLSKLAGGSKCVASAGLDVQSNVTARIRSAVEAVATWHLVHSVLDTMAELDMKLLHAYYIEMNTILVITKMELTGLHVNLPCLEKLSNTLVQQNFALERKAYQLAGRTFSFSSSTDVAKVLGMYNGKKVSTNKQVLESNEHPVSSLIVQWRKINSILTKTIYPLLRVVKNNRIYGNCIIQNSTGRISMHEPNLQSVPRNFDAIDPSDNARTVINCREAFETKDKFLLLSADYCQLELRLLAHLSKDKLLISIMNSNCDVFKSIAAKLNTIPEIEVTDDLRQKAKQICYGIIYGMGVRCLADQMETVEEEAAVFLEMFHSTYPSIKIYIQETIKKCRENGFVETIGGRRRYLPNINHHDSVLKSQAERQAVNTTIQGSAADIAKNAMVIIDNFFNEKFKLCKNKPQLVLQLHDEFLYEVPEKYVNAAAKIVKNSMENSVQLTVPFPVKVKTGKSWGTLIEKSF